MSFKDALALAELRLQERARLKIHMEHPEMWAREMLRDENHPDGMFLWSKQVEIGQSLVNNSYTAVKSCHGSGKAEVLSAKLPTPTGWTTMADVRVGDQLLDERGVPTTVTAKSEVWDDQDVYDVTFDDGSVRRVAGAHEWDVLDLNHRVRGVQDWRDHWYSTKRRVETQVLAESLRTSGGQLRWRVPLAESLHLPDADLPIDPYTLGLWLADGHSNAGRITIGATKLGVVQYLAYEHTIQKYEDREAWLIKLPGFTSVLRAAGVLNNKHIPMAYLRGSDEQRRALLAGLVDGDGFMIGKSDVGIEFTHKRLSDDTRELISSLGSKTFRTEGVAAYTKDGERHEVGTRYRMAWRPLSNPFRVRGRDWSDGGAQRSRHTQRTIVSIEKVATEPTQCVTVDSPNHLYLSGESFIPTHNSHSAAVFVCWFIATRLALTNNPNSVYVITTAPTYAQVHKVLWENIRAFHAMGNLPGYITQQDEWKIVTADGRTVEIASGRKPADTDTNGFQGIHRDHLMIVLDEANGIREELFRGAMSMLTGDMSQQKMLAIGNPDDPNSLFGRQDADDRKRSDAEKVWNWIQIKAWDTPNFTGEEVPDRVAKAVLAKSWVDRARKQWREDDARWISKIEAEFPTASTDSMFPLNLIEQARDNEVDPTWSIEANILGVDLARMGDDRSVVMQNINGTVKLLDSWSKRDTVESAQQVDKLARETEAQEVRVDVGAFGWGVVDMLRRFATNSSGRMDYKVVKMDGSAVSPDPKKWKNARAFWYDSLKQQMMLNAIQIPNADELDLELRAIRYFITKTGSLQIEEKAEIKKRLEGKSTDYADALIYASADLGMYIEEDRNAMHPGDTSVLDFGQELLLRQLAGGFSVSPV